MDLKSFDEIMEIIARREVPADLLLGNGFSISAFPKIFTYKNIFENADFAGHEFLRDVFERLETHDFEEVMWYLKQLEKTSGILTKTEIKFLEEIEFLKEILIKTISVSHPERPDYIDDDKYQNVGDFLQKFRNTRSGYKGGNIFTLNYDLLLYWTMNRTGITADCNDGFTSSAADSEYVIWSGEHSAFFSDIFFLHGALHIFDAGSAVKKNTWNRTDISLIDQTKNALDSEYFPIFVTEGTSEEKKNKIFHNAYLYASYRKFCTEMNTGFDTKKDEDKNCLVIFGHSLDESDNHVLHAIPDGKIRSIYVSIHGDPESEDNKKIYERCHYLNARRGGTLDFTFYSAESVNLWR